VVTNHCTLYMGGGGVCRTTSTCHDVTAAVNKQSTTQSQISPAIKVDAAICGLHELRDARNLEANVVARISLLRWLPEPVWSAPLCLDEGQRANEAVAWDVVEETTFTANQEQWRQWTHQKLLSTRNLGTITHTYKVP
jgi:hypothetical protein